ncbi:MAG: bacteriohemerythrin [Alphaproteobacteria bacterium]|nr:bacteriohemerythrin [Alphaproteobacteria bacterium]MBF0251504.1 bacteriohemerythrin [Alphaproteobacteria bacterium]
MSDTNQIDLKWERRFETGHDRIDFEHRIFLDIIVSIKEEILAGRDKARILRLLAELLAYSHFHFVSEGNIMLDCGYPGYKGHADHHQHLNEAFHDHMRMFEMGDKAANDILDFLVEWFVNHTVHEDAKIAQYVRKHPRR